MKETIKIDENKLPAKVQQPYRIKKLLSKREEIKEMRKNGIPINRTIRYSENYKIYK